MLQTFTLKLARLSALIKCFETTYQLAISVANTDQIDFTLINESKRYVNNLDEIFFLIDSQILNQAKEILSSFFKQHLVFLGYNIEVNQNLENIINNMLRKI